MADSRPGEVLEHFHQLRIVVAQRGIFDHGDRAEQLDRRLPEIKRGLVAIERRLGIAGAADQLGQRGGSLWTSDSSTSFIGFIGIVPRLRRDCVILADSVIPRPTSILLADLDDAGLAANRVSPGALHLQAAVAGSLSATSPN